MRKLLVFEIISIDGYFTGANNDLSVLKNAAEDQEFDAFVAQNASGEGVLLFGRVTYEMMASFWPTPAAQETLPDVARRMNARSKLVFSRTLRDAPWNNTTLVSGDAVEHVRKLKEEPGPDLVVLGSGTIVAQLAQARLVDAYQFVIVPVALGKGRTVFDGIAPPLNLQLGKTRSFRNGNLFLTYEGAKDAADHPVHLV